MMVMLKDFNPRSREGSDERGVAYAHLPLISIHAPVKGATTVQIYGTNTHGISIHAPVKGATYFDPIGGELRGISIHAPVKGATSVQDRIKEQQIFQSTLP